MAKISPPLVSVCMTMHNASLYLRECIDSVLSQTLVDFEFIIVDDGSTDESVAIVNSYDDQRIRLIIRKHNYISSLNHMLSEAKGIYIARMDADDVMLPNRLKIQSDYLQSNPYVDILGCDAIEVINNSAYNLGLHAIKDTTTCWDCKTIRLYDLAIQNPVCHPTVMIRRKSLTKHKLRYNPEYLYAEDYKLWVDALMSGLRIDILPIQVLYYRISSAQVSNQHQIRMNATACAIKSECENFLANKANEDYICPEIMDKGLKLTVIIPFLNEGAEVWKTVENIRKYAGYTVDIVVINDHSFDGINYIEKLAPFHIYYIYNDKRKGVAGCRDLAVKLIKTPFFLFLDAHMRIYESESLRLVESMLEANDRQLLCAQSIPLYADQETGELILQQNYSKGYGAFHLQNKKSMFPNLEWCQYEHNHQSNLEEIPTVLGAAYAASKRYWLYLHGLYGLKSYGCDEAFISYKVWMEGGQCILIKNFITGHLYRNCSPYATLEADKIYNSLYLCSLIYSEKEMHWSKAYAMSQDFEAYQYAYNMLQSDLEVINKEKEYYDSIFTKTNEFINSKHIYEKKVFLGHIHSSINPPKISYEIIHNYINSCNSISIVNGLCAILIYLSYCNGDAVQPLINEAVNRLYKNNRLNELIDYALDFENGLFGLGLTLMYLKKKNLIERDINATLEQIDEYITLNVDLDKLMSTNLFKTGIGGCIAYIICRLESSEQSDLNSPIMNLEFLMAILQISKSIVSNSNYDIYTYYHALVFIDIVENDYQSDSLNISNWIDLPSSLDQLSSETFSLRNGLLGYSLSLLKLLN